MRCPHKTGQRLTDRKRSVTLSLIVGYILLIDTLKVKERKKKKKGQVSMGTETCVELVFATSEDFRSSHFLGPFLLNCHFAFDFVV